MKILFTCAGRRNYLIEFFKNELSELDQTIATDMQASAPSLKSADIGIVVPSIEDSNYINIISELCREHKVDCLISLNDLELPILSKYNEHFKGLNCKLLVSNSEVIDICFDKMKTVEFAKEIGIKTPKSYCSYNSALEAINSGELNFPLVVKPRWGSASIGIEFPRNLEEFELIFKLVRIKLKNSELYDLGNKNFELIIQEKIDGVEFGVDILNDFDQITQLVYVKEKLSMRAGETDKSVLRDEPEIESAAFLVGNALRHIGNLDCDFFMSKGEVYLLEMNPRFGGGYPFTHLSGGNYVKVLLGWLSGQDNKDLLNSLTKDYDNVFSKCDRLIEVNKK